MSAVAGSMVEVMATSVVGHAHPAPSPRTGDLRRRSAGGRAVPTFVGWRAGAALRHTRRMASALTAERVRRDVEVVARAGLDIDTFLAEAVDSLQRAVPYVAACLATVDPSTELLTGTRKYGDLLGRDAHDHEWGLIEYGPIERTAFSELSQAGIAGRRGARTCTRETSSGRTG